MFTTSGLVALDEYGVPLQIAEKLRPHLGSHDTVDEAIDQLRKLDVRRVVGLTEFEREMIQDAQAGLGAHVAVEQEVRGRT